MKTHPPCMNYVWLILLALAACLVLSGCAHHQLPPPVKVLIPVKCAAHKPATPVYPTVTPDAGIYDRVKTILAEREMRIAYEGQLEASVSACE